MTVNGGGLVAITNSNGYTAGTTLSAGTLQVGNASALGSGNLVISGGALTSTGTTAYALANPLTLSGNIALGSAVNNGGLTFTAPGRHAGRQRLAGDQQPGDDRGRPQRRH